MLVRTALELGKYLGFKFDMGYKRLQYIDDTLIVGEKRWINILIIKVHFFFLTNKVHLLLF